VLGSLPRYATATGYVVTPVVGLVVPGFVLEIDTFEVEEVFEPPLAFLMNPPITSVAWSISVDCAALLCDAVRGRAALLHLGATAAMLRNLYHLLGREMLRPAHLAERGRGPWAGLRSC